MLVMVCERNGAIKSVLMRATAGATDRESKGRETCALTVQLDPPLVPLAGFAGAGVTEAAPAKHKLMVLEAHTASHTGTGVGPAVRRTH